MKRVRLHPAIIESLGYEKNITASKILAKWKARTSSICKPCWELHYCAYGPLVEQFPLLPATLADAEEHNNYFKSCLSSGKTGDGSKLDNVKRRYFKKEVSNFKKSDYPKSIPQVLLDASCRVFGHICPVFYVCEPLTETKQIRSHSRSIPRDVMIKVVRRDGQICQKCHQPVPDNEIEFDHIIPYSKGGSSTVGNLRLIHRRCNRKKGSSLQELLSANPLMFLKANL